jgi:hypothetical protein
MLAFSAGQPQEETDIDGLSRDQVLLMMRMVHAAAEREADEMAGSDDQEEGAKAPQRHHPWPRDEDRGEGNAVIYDGSKPDFCSAVRDSMFGGSLGWPCVQYLITPYARWPTDTWSTGWTSVPIPHPLWRDPRDPLFDPFALDPWAAEPAGRQAPRTKMTLGTPTVVGRLSGRPAHRWPDHEPRSPVLPARPPRQREADRKCPGERRDRSRRRCLQSHRRGLESARHSRGRLRGPLLQGPVVSRSGRRLRHSDLPDRSRAGTLTEARLRQSTRRAEPRGNART